MVLTIFAVTISFAGQRVEQNLADSHEMGGDFHELIVLDVLQSLLKRELYGGREDYLLVRSGGAHVGELLGLADVDVQVPFPCVLADYLPAVVLLARLHEEAAAVQQLVYGVGNCLARLKRYKRAVVALLYIALVGLVLLETVCYDGLSLGCRKEV